MMNPADLLTIDRDSSLSRKDGREIYIKYATAVDCPTCGFDEESYASKLVNCPTCNGKGKVYTWHTSQCQARINWQTRPDLVLIRGGQIWMGDVVLLISREERPVIQKILDNVGYLILDGSSYRPTAIHDTGLGAEVIVPCEKVNSDTIDY